MPLDIDQPSVTFSKAKKVEPPKPATAAEKLPDADVEKRKKEVEEAGKATAKVLFSNTADKKKADEKAASKPTSETEVDHPIQPVPENKEVVSPEPVKPTPKKPRVPKKTPSTEELIERSASSAAERVVEKLAPEVEEVVESELSSEDQEDMAVLQKMESRQPGKYRGLPEKFLAFAKSRYEYESKWLKANPDKDFNPEDEEHAEFFKKQPSFDERDYNRAEQVLVAEEALENQMRPERERAQIQQEITKAKPIIAEQINSRVVKLVKDVAPEFSKILVDEKGRLNISKENISKVMESDPIAGEVLYGLVNDELTPMLIELEKTTIPRLNYKLNAENPVHAKILGQIKFYEEAMSEAPDEVRNRVVGGVSKEFITLADKNKMLHQINSSKVSNDTKQAKISALDQKYWTVGVDDVEDLILDDIIQKAKGQIERFNKIVSKKFGKPAAEVVKIAADKASEVSRPQPSFKPSKPAPPKGIDTSDVVQTHAPNGSEPEKLSKQVSKVLFES